MKGIAEGRQALDVAALPPTAFDTKAPIWWGNALLLMIETAMFGILAALYFNVIQNTSPFPPPRVDRLPVLYDSYPDLTLPVIGLIVLMVSLVPGIWLDISARRGRPRAIKMGLLFTLAFNIAAFVIRYYEFDSLHFKWNDNAYGSILWILLGVHLFHIIVMGCEDTLLLAWALFRGIDGKHTIDITVTAVYWYWIVAIWVLLFPMIYILPRTMY